MELHIHGVELIRLYQLVPVSPFHPLPNFIAAKEAISFNAGQTEEQHPVPKRNTQVPLETI